MLTNLSDMFEIRLGSMIKLCTKNDISRRVRRLVSTLSLKCLTSESHCNEYPSLRDSQVKAKGDEAFFEV